MNKKNPIDINDLMLFPVNTTEDVAETTVMDWNNKLMGVDSL